MLTRAARRSAGPRRVFLAGARKRVASSIVLGASAEHNAHRGKREQCALISRCARIDAVVGLRVGVKRRIRRRLAVHNCNQTKLNK